MITHQKTAGNWKSRVAIFGKLPQDNYPGRRPQAPACFKYWKTYLHDGKKQKKTTLAYSLGFWKAWVVQPYPGSGSSIICGKMHIIGFKDQSWRTTSIASSNHVLYYYTYQQFHSSSGLKTWCSDTKYHRLGQCLECSMRLMSDASNVGLVGLTVVHPC